MHDGVTGGSWLNACRQTSSAETLPAFARGLYCFTQLAVTSYIITSPKLFSLKCIRWIQMAADRAGWYHQGDVDNWKIQHSGRLFSPSIFFFKKAERPDTIWGSWSWSACRSAEGASRRSRGCWLWWISTLVYCFDHVTAERGTEATGAKFNNCPLVKITPAEFSYKFC